MTYCSKESTFPRESSGLCSLLLRGNLWAPEMFCSIEVSLIAWGLQPHQIVYANDALMAGALGHMVLSSNSEGAGSEGQPLSCQPFLCDHIPIKTLDTEAQASWLVGNTPQVLSGALFLGDVRAVPTLLGEDSWKFPAWTPWGSAPCTYSHGPLQSVSFYCNTLYLWPQ